MESYDKEDEDEHERLMKEQDKHENNQLMNCLILMMLNSHG